MATGGCGLGRCLRGHLASLAVLPGKGGRDTRSTVLSPPGQPSGLVAVHIGDRDTFLAVEYLLEAGVLTRNIHENNALRLSTGFYNTEEDVDLALGKIYEFMKR